MQRSSVRDAMRRVQMKVVRPSRRTHYVMRWVEPKTNRRRERSTGTPNKRDANLIAGELAREIAEGAFRDEYPWHEFCQRYESEYMSSLGSKSLESWRTVKRWLNQITEPQTVNEIDAALVVRFANGLRRSGKVGEVTIGTYLARLRASLNWAADLGIITAAPVFRMPKKAKGRSRMARSRAITIEEFERIVLAVPRIRPHDADLWIRFLHGLWHCGFRLLELLELSWDAEAPRYLDASRAVPFVRLTAEADKAGRDREKPITRDFWAVCCETPEDDRSGPVFPLPGRRRRQMTDKQVCRVISGIGRRAGVVTDATTGKCATSHDIGRRAFATRMDDGSLTLAELQKWMGHGSIQTTINYYRHTEREQLQRKVWGEGE